VLQWKHHHIFQYPYGNKAKLLPNIFIWKWASKKEFPNSKLLGTPFGKKMETKDVNEFLIKQLKIQILIVNPPSPNV
jgi:hypothetical protein